MNGEQALPSRYLIIWWELQTEQNFAIVPFCKFMSRGKQMMLEKDMGGEGLMDCFKVKANVMGKKVRQNQRK